MSIDLDNVTMTNVNSVTMTSISLLSLRVFLPFIVNITAAWAGDREFVHKVGPAGAPFGRLGPPRGTHWDAFGLTLVSLRSSWDTFGVHVDRLGPQRVSTWEFH